MQRLLFAISIFLLIVIVLATVMLCSSVLPTGLIVSNAFLQSYAGANGIKTGSNAGSNDWCMVFSAYRHGHLLIGAEMQAPSEDQVFLDAKNILDKGFAQP